MLLTDISRMKQDYTKLWKCLAPMFWDLVFKITIISDHLANIS